MKLQQFGEFRSINNLKGMMNILKNKLDLAKGKVEVFATNLQTPSHMEWTPEGRLLVSETSAGRVTDVTDGGKITEKNIVSDELEGPSSIVPLEDGRIYICETLPQNSGISTTISADFPCFYGVFLPNPFCVFKQHYPLQTVDFLKTTTQINPPDTCIPATF
ncbi:hypothetical protein Len3610_06270 [Lentibacillus sp. CBA3610]|nr:hypothetical protein Len3610_06270 [Lentibacillus sp. CBA3610]